MTCPVCASPSLKVIYMGLPLRLCEGTDAHITGAFSWLMRWLPFNGMFVVYEGSYWRALWRWLTDWPEDGE